MTHYTGMYLERQVVDINRDSKSLKASRRCRTLFYFINLELLASTDQCSIFYLFIVFWCKLYLQAKGVVQHHL